MNPNLKVRLELIEARLAAIESATRELERRDQVRECHERNDRAARRNRSVLDTNRSAARFIFPFTPLRKVTPGAGMPLVETDAKHLAMLRQLATYMYEPVPERFFPRHHRDLEGWTAQQISDLGVILNTTFGIDMESTFENTWRQLVLQHITA